MIKCTLVLGDSCFNNILPIVVVYVEAVTQKCSIKKCSLKTRKIHRKTPL